MICTVVWRTQIFKSSSFYYWIFWLKRKIENIKRTFEACPYSSDIPLNICDINKLYSDKYWREIPQGVRTSKDNIYGSYLYYAGRNIIRYPSGHWAQPNTGSLHSKNHVPPCYISTTQHQSKSNNSREYTKYFYLKKILIIRDVLFQPERC